MYVIVHFKTSLVWTKLWNAHRECLLVIYACQHEITFFFRPYLCQFFFLFKEVKEEKVEKTISVNVLKVLKFCNLHLFTVHICTLLVHVCLYSIMAVKLKARASLEMDRTLVFGLLQLRGQLLTLIMLYKFFVKH